MMLMIYYDFECRISYIISRLYADMSDDAGSVNV